MCGSLSGGTPGPSSLTSMATRSPAVGRGDRAGGAGRGVHEHVHQQVVDGAAEQFLVADRAQAVGRRGPARSVRGRRSGPARRTRRPRRSGRPARRTGRDAGPAGPAAACRRPAGPSGGSPARSGPSPRRPRRCCAARPAGRARRWRAARPAGCAARGWRRRRTGASAPGWPRARAGRSRSGPACRSAPRRACPPRCAGSCGVTRSVRSPAVIRSAWPAIASIGRSPRRSTTNTPRPMSSTTAIEPVVTMTSTLSMVLATWSRLVPATRDPPAARSDWTRIWFIPLGPIRVCGPGLARDLGGGGRQDPPVAAGAAVGGDLQGHLLAVERQEGHVEGAGERRRLDVGRPG